MLRFFDFQVNLSTDQGRIEEIEVTARMTGNPEVILKLRVCERRPRYGRQSLPELVEGMPALHESDLRMQTLLR
jgi:hypothetical protein